MLQVSCTFALDKDHTNALITLGHGAYGIVSLRNKFRTFRLIEKVHLNPMQIGATSQMPAG